MKVILTQNISNLGAIGSIVNVKNGYARNYLIPNGMVAVADESNKKALGAQLRALEKKKSLLLEDAKKQAKSFENLSITLAKKVGEDEKIFGSVTTAEIEALLLKEGINVNKKDIEILDDIKKVGVYQAQVKLHPEVAPKFKVWVVAE